MSEPVTAGEIAAAFLEHCGVSHAFGVISIHNMPILDAIAKRAKIRFVPARSEGGAVNMADANARVSGRIGVAVSSTGTAAGNACGAIVEAMTAGTPLIHLTGQIDSPHLDRQKGFLHEAPDQLGMLAAAGKAAFRVWSPETMLVASIASCFILTFRAVARASKFDWNAVTCEVTGVLDRVDRVTQFTEFYIDVSLRLPEGGNTHQAHRLAEKSEQICLVTNSLTGKKILHVAVAHDT